MLGKPACKGTLLVRPVLNQPCEKMYAGVPQVAAAVMQPCGTKGSPPQAFLPVPVISPRHLTMPPTLPSTSQTASLALLTSREPPLASLPESPDSLPADFMQQPESPLHHFLPKPSKAMSPSLLSKASRSLGPQLEAQGSAQGSAPGSAQGSAQGSHRDICWRARSRVRIRPYRCGHAYLISWKLCCAATDFTSPWSVLCDASSVTFMVHICNALLELLLAM